jgi:hypothetical protein
MKTRSKWILFFLILIILIIIGLTVGIIIYERKKTASGSGGGGSGGSGGGNSNEGGSGQAPIPLTPPSGGGGSPGTGLWVRNPGAAYVNGLDYADSQTYCTNSGGTLAQLPQLMDAYTEGFQYCSNGWFAGPASGYVMQSQQPGCGNQGFNPGPSDVTTPLATYCYGPIPTTSEVGASVVM